jgi:hypothetical protein
MIDKRFIGENPGGGLTLTPQEFYLNREPSEGTLVNRTISALVTCRRLQSSLYCGSTCITYYKKDPRIC